MGLSPKKTKKFRELRLFWEVEGNKNGDVNNLGSTGFSGGSSAPLGI